MAFLAQRKYELLQRIKDDSGNDVGIVVGFHTDASGNQYAVVCLDAQYRTTDTFATFSTANMHIDGIPNYTDLRLYEAPETATQNCDALLATATAQGETAPAVTECRSKVFVIGGETYYGQLPTLTELISIMNQRDNINTNDPSTSGPAIEPNTYSYSSSTQNDDSKAWTAFRTGQITAYQKNIIFNLLPIIELPNPVGGEADAIKNLALTEINHENIDNFYDTTNTDAPIVNQQYALAKAVALSMYQWSWSVRTAELDGADNESTQFIKYKKVFDLPEDYVAYLACYTNKEMTILADYFVVGTKIYANADKLYIKYSADVDESVFTPEFVDWFKIFLAARLNSYLNGDMQRQQLLENNEPFYFRKAKNIDSKNNKHDSLDGNPLLWIRGKMGGGI